MTDKHYSIEEVFEFVGEDMLNPEYTNSKEHRKEKQERREFDGFMVKPCSQRYQTFYHKGTTCASCGRQGAYFKLDKQYKDYDGPNRHFNLYAEDGTLMTKDHIVPKSKGGKNSIKNYQTMCCLCNVKKADK